VEQEAIGPKESGLSYDEVKDICLAWLVLVNTLKGGKWVPSFVGRSDVYIVNKMGGLKQKNRKHSVDAYLDGDGAKHQFSTSCSTTTFYFDFETFRSVISTGS
jgi:hypothetical protein